MGFPDTLSSALPVLLGELSWYQQHRPRAWPGWDFGGGPGRVTIPPSGNLLTPCATGHLDRTQLEHSRHKSQEGLQTCHVQEELKMGWRQCVPQHTRPPLPTNTDMWRGRECVVPTSFLLTSFPPSTTVYLFNSGHVAFIEFQGLCPDLTLGEAKFWFWKLLFFAGVWRLGIRIVLWCLKFSWVYCNFLINNILLTFPPKELSNIWSEFSLSILLECRGDCDEEPTSQKGKGRPQELNRST